MAAAAPPPGAGAIESCDALYDPLAADVLTDPYPCFARLRAAGAVLWHDRLASWLVTDHATCSEVLRRTDVFASDFRRIGEEVPDAALSVQMLDPPDHTPVRHLLAAAVRTRGIATLADDVRRIAERHVEATPGDEPFDFVARVARPVALETISYVLGVAPPEGDEFEAVSNAIVRSMDGGLDPSRIEPGREARGRLSALLDGWAGAASDDGLLGYVTTHRERYGVPAAVATNSVRAVLHAGYESASRLLGNAAAVLVRHPEMAPALRDPAVLDDAVEELVRLDAPVQADARACVSDTDLAGRRLRRGDVVVLLLGAANRDPAAFDEPDSFVPTRRPNRHLGFGLGAHACLGSHLARFELSAVLAAAVGSGRALVLAGDPEQEPTATLRGLLRLPVRWEPRGGRS
ncbi:MAG: cytochrome P450 [Frankiaceae bacterium]